MASPTQWTWVWASSGRWSRTGKPGVMQSTESQRVEHNWATEWQPVVVKSRNTPMCAQKHPRESYCPGWELTSWTGWLARQDFFPALEGWVTWDQCPGIQLAPLPRAFCRKLLPPSGLSLARRLLPISPLGMFAFSSTTLSYMLTLVSEWK